jgi:hypothetical protein
MASQLTRAGVVALRTNVARTVLACMFTSRHHVQKLSNVAACQAHSHVGYSPTAADRPSDIFSDGEIMQTVENYGGLYLL